MPGIHPSWGSSQREGELQTGDSALPVDEQGQTLQCMGWCVLIWDFLHGLKEEGNGVVYF